MYYDRYKEFRGNGGVKVLPFIKIPEKSTDKLDVYKTGKTRFDKLSQKHYGNPYHGFLILLANPEYGGLEFDIPDGSIIRIPFPFKQTLQQYEEEVNKYIQLYGID
jgi:hypothetical protein